LEVPPPLIILHWLNYVSGNQINLEAVYEDPDNLQQYTPKKDIELEECPAYVEKKKSDHEIKLEECPAYEQAKKDIELEECPAYVEKRKSEIKLEECPVYGQAKKDGDIELEARVSSLH
jgi:hypothetical protein